VLGLSFVLLLGTCFYFLLPGPLFNDPYSVVVTSDKGELLSAHIADDGQWRFPESDSIPPKFETALLYFEDEYFYRHPGFNPISMVRAMRQNIKARRIISGGSTITMQVIRLSRKGQPRTFLEKLKELVFALRIEVRYSKEKILELYASHAPFGGNVVGLEAASWRYFGRPASLLSWGEAATLAVLPNAPGLIHPGKNRETLLKKRNRLLKKLFAKGKIDSLTFELALDEPLPGKPKALPNITPHLLNRMQPENKFVRTNIKKSWQVYGNYLAEKYHNALSQNEIHNLAILVVEVKTGKVLTYIGNSPCRHEQQGGAVDVIRASRSTGSTLKPFLFASALDQGLIVPASILADVPTRIAGYAPKNFDKVYHGAVRADNALTRSLNIPAVRLLRNYGLEKFHHQLKKLNFPSINQGPGHYGLTLILGGAEASLWELVRAYASISAEYQMNVIQDFTSLPYRLNLSFQNDKVELFKPADVFSKSAIWQTLNVLTGVNRPNGQAGWKQFASARKVAWKTGTSFGHRDAWAIGITPEYVVGVWVGNANGEGRPGLTGSMVAAPVMFDMWRFMPTTTWFDEGKSELIDLIVCAKSGYRATANCEETKTIQVGEAAYRLAGCPYCRKIHLDKDENFRVNSSCYAVGEMITKGWFVLSPGMEWYYKKQNPMYKQLPPLKSGCEGDNSLPLEMLYPEQNARIFVPRILGGKSSKTVFEVVHQRSDAVIYWHLDGVFVGETNRFHQIELSPGIGKHQLTLVDDRGFELSRTFEIEER